MNDVNFSACKFSGDIVPYMYGELSPSGSSAFESHLLDCGDCTDEFAAISSARYDVYEWKSLEFEPLATPVFEIPYETSTAAGVSWLDKVRFAFGRRWAASGLAFAGLAIVSVIAVVFLASGDSGREVVENNSENRTVIGPVTIDGTTSVGTVPEAIVRPEVRPVRSDVQKGKIVSPGRSESRRGNQVRKVDRPATIRTGQTAVKRQNAPRLNEFTEDEDTSLRLAELFEDIETSD